MIWQRRVGGMIFVINDSRNHTFGVYSYYVDQGGKISLKQPVWAA